MITIKQYNGRWRLVISGEEWEFKDLLELKVALDDILNLKEAHGRIGKYPKVKGGYF
jgi:hypothetical protein